MSTDPTQNARNAAQQTQPSDETVVGNEDVPALKRQIAQLSADLVEATAEVERYRRAAHALVRARVVPGAGEPGGPLIAELEREGLAREAVLLRARCSNLRHWCRALLDEPAAAGVLDGPTAADLRATAPAVGETEAHDLIGQLTRGGSIPTSHRLAPPTTDANQLRETVAALAAEHERLRKAFFALYDHLYPDDNLTDEYFFAQQGGPTYSMAEVLAEIEREFGNHP
jgi:hypothetical protein